MKIKHIIRLLRELDSDLDIEFIELYEVGQLIGLEIMTVDEDFYYCESEAV